MGVRAAVPIGRGGGRPAEQAGAGALIPFVAPVVALLVWGISLRGVDPDRMSAYGLISVLPAAFYLALAVLTSGFVLALRRPAVPTIVFVVHMGVLILILHATPAILYETVRYSWSWKHVGIVDYILRHGGVDPTIPFLTAYHNWPGFFSLMALVVRAAGLRDALSLALWAPPFFELLFLAPLLLIARSLTSDRRLAWLAVWLFYVTNWIGQDYFSPQATSLFLYLGMVAIALRWLRLGAPPSAAAIARFTRSRRVADALHRLVSRAARSEPEVEPTGDGQRQALVAIAILAGAVISWSHQLTPFFLILALGSLVLFQRLAARALPLVMIVLTGAWVTYMAVGFLKANLYWIVQSIGNPESNLTSGFHAQSSGAPGAGSVSTALAHVALVDRTLTALVAVLALAGAVRRIRAGRLDLSAMLLAAVPAVMIFANAYGSEMLFRVYLFGLPFLAFLAAGLVFPTPRQGASRGGGVACLALCLLLLAGFCVAYYGKERVNYFSKDEVRASRWLVDHAPPGSILLSGTYNYPYAFRDYERYRYAAIGEEPFDDRATAVRRPVATVYRLMGGGSAPHAYFILTEGQKAGIDVTGAMPAGSLDRIERAVARSGTFRRVYHSRDAIIYTLASKGAA